MNCADEIKARRRESRVSQAELAVALGRTQTWICSVERGVIRVDDATFKRLLSEIRRTSARKKEIAEAQREATARVIHDFENRKSAAKAPA